MNNNIKEDYVSFEVAKLLKEKGFSWNNFLLRVVDGIPKETKVPGIPTSIDNAFPCYNNQGKEIRPQKYSDTNVVYKHYPRPTHALAIKWIRENFGIDIHAKRTAEKNYMSAVRNMEGLTLNSYFNYDSPEEATEAALIYALTNLI